MHRHYYILDASALVYKYIRSTNRETQRIQDRLTRLFVARASAPHLVIFQIPSLCMAECSKAFAKACFEQKLYGTGDRATTAYRRLRNSMLTDVIEDRIIHSFELKREHFEDIEDIFIKDYSLEPPRRMKHMLNSNDALIISMTAWIARHVAKGLNYTTLITADDRMAFFCNSFPQEYPRTVNIRTDDIPGCG